MKKTLNIKGIHCKSCKMIIEESVGELKGVNKVEVSLANNTANIDFDEKTVKETDIKAAIEKEGYKVVK